MTPASSELATGKGASPATGAAGAVDVRASRPADDEARDALVERLPAGTFFHLSGWRRVVQRVFGHAPRDLLAWRGDELVGVLPLMATRRPSGRANLISMPYAVYGGPVAVDDAVERTLVDAAVAQAERARVGRLELRYAGEAAVDLPASDLYATFVADLPERVEDVLARMPKKARAEARKARDRHDLVLAPGLWYLDDLVRMFHVNKRNLGSPGLPPKLFTSLCDEFGDAVTVHLVRRGREPLAAVMSFLWRGTVYAYYAGTAEGADRAYSASNFMYMALREWAVEAGFRTFDFGRSRRDSGAYRFKTHQGFEGRDLAYRFHLVRDQGLPTFTPSNPRTKVLRDTWSRLPLWATRRLSTALARYLP